MGDTISFILPNFDIVVAWCWNVELKTVKMIEERMHTVETDFELNLLLKLNDIDNMIDGVENAKTDW